MVRSSAVSGAADNEDGGLGARRLSRRWFLGGLGALLVGLFGLWGIRREWSDSLHSLVESQLDFLNLDPAGLEAFSRDVMKDPRVPFPANFNLYSRVPVRFYEFLPAREELARLETYVVRQYLLSTDFFLRGGDESMTVRYLAYFDRHSRSCTNPFIAL